MNLKRVLACLASAVSFHSCRFAATSCTFAANGLINDQQTIHLGGMINQPVSATKTKMFRSTLFLLFALAQGANAIVIRNDVDDAQYRVVATEFPQLVDLPGEGHGVLIAPRWILTAAHAVSWQAEVDVVVLKGAPRRVEKIILHAGYKKLPQTLIDAAMKSGNAAAVTAFLASSDDIALVKLAAPVTDVAPAGVFRGAAIGQQIQIIGKGATGTGTKGHCPEGPNRTDLRRAFSVVTSAKGRWLSYTFRRPPHALPLEGAAGNGDSGGPLLIAVGDQWQVAGLTSWKRLNGDSLIVHPGQYGQINYGVRLHHYLDWIEATMATDSANE